MRKFQTSPWIVPAFVVMSFALMVNGFVTFHIIAILLGGWNVPLPALTRLCLAADNAHLFSAMTILSFLVMSHTTGGAVRARTAGGAFMLTVAVTVNIAWMWPLLDMVAQVG